MSLQLINYRSFYVKDVNVQNTPQAFKVNGITDEYRNLSGISFQEIYQYLLMDLIQCSTIVCHGVAFDIPKIRYECQQHKLSDEFLNYFHYMDTKPLKKNPRMTLEQAVRNFDYNKYPFLKDKSAHDSLYDVCLTIELLLQNIMYHS